MTRQVLYVAAPLRPTAEEIAKVYAEGGCYRGEAPTVALRHNLGRAKSWLARLQRSFAETTFIAPWIASIEAGADDSDPAQREAVMRDNEAVIERCDGIVLCGGRISEGMRREMKHGKTRGPGWPLGDAFEVYDLTSLGTEPPHPALRMPGDCSFREWHRDLVVG